MTAEKVERILSFRTDKLSFFLLMILVLVAYNTIKLNSAMPSIVIKQHNTMTVVSLSYN